MSSPVYAWLYEDPFHSIYLKITTSISLASNGLLLFVIFTTSSSSIGSYRYLLAVFAVSDVLTSMAHALFLPVIHMTNTGVLFFPLHGEFMIGEYPCDTMLCMLFIATYYETFLILAYHYIYRSKMLNRGVTRSCTDNWSGLQWTITGVCCNCFCVTVLITTTYMTLTPTDSERLELVPPEILEIYHVDFRNRNRGFAMIALLRPDKSGTNMEWHALSVAGLSVMFAAFFGTGCVIAYCIGQINGVFRSSDNHLTAATRKTQTNLFRALLIQSAIPLLFSYIPLAIIMIVPPATGFSMGAFGNVLFSITAIFPSIDALFVLFFIRRFRTAVTRLLFFPMRSRIASSVGWLSTV